MLVFTLNIIYEILLMIRAHCKTEKKEPLCACDECKEAEPAKKIGHVALVDSSKYYIDPTDFADCRFECVSKMHYLSIKAFWMTALGCNIVITCWMNTYKAHLIFFFSYWGVTFTFIATALEILAAQNPKRYQAAAVLLSEMALTFNFTITPMFWFVLAPEIFSVLSWQGYDIICRLHYTCTHSLPIITSLLNLYLTKNFKLYPEDWRIIFISCMAYIYCNYLGTIIEGEPVYPGYYTGWESAPWAIFAYSCLAVANAAVFKVFAELWNKYRP